MARLKKTTPRPYGRQAKGKTIKSLSLDADVLAKAEKEAKSKGMNFSEYVNAFLGGTLGIIFHPIHAGTDLVSLIS